MKNKKSRAFIIVFALVFAAALAGCSAQPNDGAQLPNPIVEVENSAAFEKLGLSIDAPQGATDVTYSIIDDRLAQVQFSLNGASYTYRTAISDDESEDISGVYEEFGEENAMSIDGADWWAIIVVKPIKSGGYLASWQYDKHLFTLYTPDQPEAEAFSELATQLAQSAYHSVYDK